MRPALHILIPAYLRTDAQQALLRATLASLPAGIDLQVVVLAQGRRPELNSIPVAHGLRVAHHPTALTKWGAVALGLDGLDESAPVMILDGDLPVTPESVRRFVGAAGGSTADIVVGARSDILLEAPDEVSEDSRLFVELVTNTMLLLLAAPDVTEDTPAPDMQGGLILVSPRLRRTVDFRGVGRYGAELEMFDRIFRRGLTIDMVAVDPTPRQPSSLRIATIIEDVVALPCFRRLNDAVVEAAGRRTPTLYGRYLRGARRRRWDHEIGAVMAAFRSALRRR
jgi:hypothetical protein